MAWWREGKMMNKKNTFSDFISCAKFLIQKKYTSKKKIKIKSYKLNSLLNELNVHEIDYGKLA